MTASCTEWCYGVAIMGTMIVVVMVLFLLNALIERGGGCSWRIFVQSLNWRMCPVMEPVKFTPLTAQEDDEDDDD